MGIPDGVTRVVLSGTLASGAETWAIGLWWHRPGLIAFDFDSGEPGDSDYLAFRDAMLACMRSGDALTDLDSYRYSGGAATEHTHATVSHAGTASAATLPCQCAIVVTLRTALATRSGRGRIYVPYTGAAVLSTTRTGDTAVINGLVDALGAYYDAVTGDSPDTIPVVVSQTLTTYNQIVSVDADAVIDTQRRRRNQITSTRHTYSLA